MKILKYCLWIPLLCAFSTFAQQSSGRDITGKVINERGEPLANANVSIKNGRGTVTNARGQFLLKNVSPNDFLQISFVGYSNQTIAVKDQSVFNIVLKQAENELDKVVVQGYGTTSDRLRTGSIVKVTSEQISKQPVMNVLDVLQGQTPGAVVTNASGYASGTVKVEIRGRNTINSGFTSEPLYIIDGVPLTMLDITNNESYAAGSQGVLKSGIGSPASGESPFFSINPADIESIEVLKDADATAIYGSRASNGVILITTKRGKATKTTVDINVYQGIEKVTTRYKMLNTSQYVAMRKEALDNDGLPVDMNNAPDLVSWDTTKYTDWQKFLFGGVGKTTDAQATLLGGNAQTSLRIGAGYHYQTDILAVSGANKRGTLSLNLNHKSLDQKLSLSLSAQYGASSVNIISVPGVSLLSPNAPDVYDASGNLNYSGWKPLDYLYPFSLLLQPYTSATKFLNSSLNINYELTKGLQLKANMGYGNIQNNQQQFTTIASQNPRYNRTGAAYYGNSFIRNVIIEPQIEYNTFINVHKLNFTLGSSFQTNETSSINAAGSGYSNDILLYSVSNAPSKFIVNSKGEYKYAALFARVNYNVKNTYIININARRDGSSRFGPGRQYGNFGSIGGAWIFSEEKFMKNTFPFLSFGKIRGSYGWTGGDQIGDYAYLSKWSFQNATYNGSIPLVSSGHTDSLFQWQVSKKTEVSLSLGFFKDKLSIDINAYRHRCNNQLVQFPTPVFTGFGSVVSNSPANVQNTGYEIILNAKAIDKSTISWETKFNIAVNRNKLLSYPNFSESPYVYQLTIGKSLNILKILHVVGVDPETGLYQFEDRNKDGEITVDQSGKTTDDRYDLDRSPKFDGGFSNTVSYKNWQLTVLFYFRKQIGANAFTFTDAAGTMSNQPLEVFEDHWQKPGDVATYAKFTTDPSDISFQRYFYNSDGRYTDASFIRLQNLSISYTLSEKVNKKMGVKNCRINISGQNLFLITKYKGSDPELQSFGSLPMAKIITAGIVCSF